MIGPAAGVGGAVGVVCASVADPWGLASGALDSSRKTSFHALISAMFAALPAAPGLAFTLGIAFCWMIRAALSYRSLSLIACKPWFSTASRMRGMVVLGAS